MLLGVTTSKKIPRILMAQGEGPLRPMAQVQALWPGRSESTVFDLSLSGMAISHNPDWSGKLKLHQSVDFSLRIKGLEDHVGLKARLVKMSENSLGFIFESMSVEGRLVIDQHTKDRLVVESMQDMPLASLNSEMRASVWLHGAFDTNILLWKNTNGDILEKAVIEYENVICVLENEEMLLHKSPSAIDESQSYFNATEIFSPLRKVSQGASWLDRWIKNVEQLNDQRGDLFLLLKLLKSHRTQ